MTDMHDAPARDQDMPVEGSISTAYLTVLADYLRPLDLAIADLPGGTALLQAAEGAIVMPVQDWRALLRYLSERLEQPDLGLRLGRSARLAHLGLLGYVLQSCGTLGAALERIQRYERLVNDINRLHWSLAESSSGGAEVVLRWGMERGRPGALVDECAIATLLQVTRQISGLPDAPVAVDFINPAPADITPYSEFFGMTPRFDQAETRISFPAALLQLPLQHPDPLLLGLLEKQVDELLRQLPEESDLVQRVRRLMAQRLRGQDASLADIAADLHVSERTLHRRLHEAGTNFRDLRESTRQHLAEEYLRDRRLTLTEVAALLGYSEQSAFTRSFRRWTGQGPKAWRSAH